MLAETDKSPSNMLKTILMFGLQLVIPNVYVALRMFLTLPVTNCEGESSFSHLGRIKNEPEVLLSLLEIESEPVRDLDFRDVVEEFARRKVIA